MTTRGKNVLAVLAAAKGEWVTGDTIAEKLGIGRPQVSAGITEARDWLGAEIETNTKRGGGWRLAGASPVAITPAPAPPLSRPAKRSASIGLTTRAAAMLARLKEAAGEYVDGRTLAAAMGATTEQLSASAAEIRAKLPELQLQGLRGSGYRIGALATNAGLPPAPRIIAKSHRAHRTTIDLLAELSPATAERVREIALQTEQSAGDTIERLIWYGVEVHRDLIAAGEHPLQLRRAA